MIHGWNEDQAQSPRASRTIATPTKSPLPPDRTTLGSVRQRTAQACDRCRERKTKCSGEYPVCYRCTARKLNCSYAERGSRRGSNRNRAPGQAGRMTADAQPPASLWDARKSRGIICRPIQYQYQPNMGNLVPHGPKEPNTIEPSQIHARNSDELRSDTHYGALLPQESLTQEFWQDKFTHPCPEAHRAEWHAQPDLYCLAVDSPTAGFCSSSPTPWGYTSQRGHAVWHGSASPTPNPTLDTSLMTWSNMVYQYRGRYLSDPPGATSHCGERAPQASPESSTNQLLSPPRVGSAESASFTNIGQFTYPPPPSLTYMDLDENLDIFEAMGCEHV